MLHTAGAAHRLPAAQQLALAAECSTSVDWRFAQMSRVMTRVIMPYDNSLQPLFQRKMCHPSCSVHSEANNLARSQKHNIQFHHPSTLHFSHFQSDFKSTSAPSPHFINTRVKNFRYCLYTETSSAIKI